MKYSVFEQKVGYRPSADDLNRVKCAQAGEYGHRQCGWCAEHDKPRFVCGCRASLPNTTCSGQAAQPAARR